MADADQHLVLRAVSFAAAAHRGQTRKDGVTPYFAHPVRVTHVIATVFGVSDPHVLAAAVLHDTIEDTTVDRDDLISEFGARVAGYVAALSKDKRLPEPEREKAYMQALVEAPVEVRLCKLADVYDNLLDSAHLGHAARKKRLEQSKEVVALFRPGFPDPWRHAIDAVCEQITAVEQIDA